MILKFIATKLRSDYNRDMEIERLHGWKVSISQALAIQHRLAGTVIKHSNLATPRYIAGLDISNERQEGIATAAAVVLEYPQLKVVETSVVEGNFDFPYIPGLLSFRESPLTLAACTRLTITPDLFLVDGQGLAHPRRLGFASHLGLFLNRPTIGCAKSLLCGSHEPPADEPGSGAEIIDRGEVIGAALRTKQSMKPIYVSIGHKIDLQTAVRWVLACCRGYRIPEPLRLAHLVAGGKLKPGKSATTELDYQPKLI